MDKGRLHRQFARPLSKLFETAIFRGNTLAVSFLMARVELRATRVVASLLY
jgi:hypothetical protein